MNPRRPLNPWPVGIGAFLGCFLAAMIGFVGFASCHRTDLVAPDYYEREVHYQGQMDRLDRTRGLRQPVRVSHDPASGQILIVLPSDHAAHQPAGHIELYRPSDVGLDRRIKLEVDARGAQAVDARELQPGLWKVRIQWAVQGREYFTEQPVVVPPRVS